MAIDQSQFLTFGISSNARYLNPHDDRTPMPRALKGVSITSSDRNLASSSPRRNPRPLPRHERYIYTYRLLANATPLHFMISYVNPTFLLLDISNVGFSAALSPTAASLSLANILSVCPSKQMASNDS